MTSDYLCYKRRKLRTLNDPFGGNFVVIQSFINYYNIDI